MVVLALSFGSHLHAESARLDDVFADQLQYELFYDFTFQANVVERFVLECTGDHDLWRTFGYATAPISNSYKHDILGMEGLVPNPFNDSSLLKSLWSEFILNLTENTDRNKGTSDPVLAAQIETVRLFNLLENDKDGLCDFVFWEEVEMLRVLTQELLDDTAARYAGTEKLKQFQDRADEGLPILRSLFRLNPINFSSKDPDHSGSNIYYLWSVFLMFFGAWLLYWRKKRKSGRRNEQGVEVFASHLKKVKAEAFDTLLLWTGCVSLIGTVIVFWMIY